MNSEKLSVNELLALFGARRNRRGGSAMRTQRIPRGLTYVGGAFLPPLLGGRHTKVGVRLTVWEHDGCSIGSIMGSR